MSLEVSMIGFVFMSWEFGTIFEGFGEPFLILV